MGISFFSSINCFEDLGRRPMWRSLDRSTYFVLQVNNPMKYLCEVRHEEVINQHNILDRSNSNDSTRSDQYEAAHFNKLMCDNKQPTSHRDAESLKYWEFIQGHASTQRGQPYEGSGWDECFNAINLRLIKHCLQDSSRAGIWRDPSLE